MIHKTRYSSSIKHGSENFFKLSHEPRSHKLELELHLKRSLRILTFDDEILLVNNFNNNCMKAFCFLKIEF
jgi:hypothetical protein